MVCWTIRTLRATQQELDQPEPPTVGSNMCVCVYCDMSLLFAPTEEMIKIWMRKAEFQY